MEVIKKKIASLKLEVSKREELICKKEEEYEKLNEDNEVWEAKNEELQSQLDKYDADLDNTENEMQVIQKQLSEAIKEREIIEREYKQMKNRTVNNSNMLDTQSEHLSRAKQIADESNMNFAAASDKLKVFEDDIDRLEHDAEMLEINNADLSAENKLMNSTLKSYQAMELNLTDKEAKAGDEIGSISASLKESLADCNTLIQKRDKLMEMADELELMLTTATQQKQEAVDSLDSTVRELGSI